MANAPLDVEIDAIAPPLAEADARAWASYYERIYRAAGARAEALPWEDLRANAALVNWLNAEGPQLLRPGGAVAVVGCGLGDDAAEVAARGYETIGFDVSEVALEWARRRHPEVEFVRADLFALPDRLRRRFDLVVEIDTIQALHPELRARAAASIASLAKSHGVVVAIARGRPDSEPLSVGDGPPFALTESELVGLFGAHGFKPLRAPDSFEDAAGVSRLRAAFQRA